LEGRAAKTRDEAATGTLKFNIRKLLSLLKGKSLKIKTFASVAYRSNPQGTAV
jgi:hypothetical protein